VGLCRSDCLNGQEFRGLRDPQEYCPCNAEANTVMSTLFPRTQAPGKKAPLSGASAPCSEAENTRASRAAGRISSPMYQGRRRIRDTLPTSGTPDPSGRGSRGRICVDCWWHWHKPGRSLSDKVTFPKAEHNIVRFPPISGPECARNCRLASIYRGRSGKKNSTECSEAGQALKASAVEVIGAETPGFTRFP